MAVDPLAHLAEQLDQLEREGLRRHARPPAKPGTLSFCSNDYLGLAGRAAPPAASGSGASRLIAGERDEHRRLERAFATWLDVEDVLAFSSGYAANVGALSALAGAGDLIVSDSLNHASLIDGARLSRARVAVVPHGDRGAIERALIDRRETRAWVVVESYYSMDADGPDLAALRHLCDTRGAALYVDEAHALGVLGPGGRGRCAEAGVTPDVLVGTLGKAFGTRPSPQRLEPVRSSWSSSGPRSRHGSASCRADSARASSRPEPSPRRPTMRRPRLRPTTSPCRVCSASVTWSPWSSARRGARCAGPPRCASTASTSTRSGRPRCRPGALASG